VYIYINVYLHIYWITRPYATSRYIHIYIYIYIFYMLTLYRQKLLTHLPIVYIYYIYFLSDARLSPLVRPVMSYVLSSQSLIPVTAGCLTPRSRPRSIPRESPPSRFVLRQPGGAQDPDEDGSVRAPRRPRELPVGRPDARRGAAARRPPPARRRGARRRQRGRARLRPRGKTSLLSQQE